MDEKQLFELINPKFTFKFAGKEYLVKKANLRQGIQYRQKVKELLDAKDENQDSKLVAFCIFLILKEVDNSITEEFVLENTPADIDVLGTLEMLGFINPKQVQAAKVIQEKLI
jgi:hypothetical protein